MKIQIDTDFKTIKVEKDINLDELFKNLKKLFPNGEWKDYKLETNTVITYWSNPIYIQQLYIYPQNPITYPWITWDHQITCSDQNTYISTNIGDSNGANNLSLNNVGNTTGKMPEFQTLTSNNSNAVDVLESREHVYCVEI